MWAIKNQTPFKAERSWILDKVGRKYWIVIVKGSFTINTRGETEIAEVQLEPLLEPEYIGTPGESSILYDSDLVGPKQITDVLLQGAVHAPGGRPTTSVTATLALANVRKEVRAVGDRLWSRDLLGQLELTQPEPFTSIPVMYERAYGGWDRSHSDPAKHRVYGTNPVGTGFAVYKENLIYKPAPNFESPHRPIRKWQQNATPVAFGPIATYWSPRQEYAGTYDERWKKDQFPLLPSDFDERYYCSAPADQQASLLRGGESVELLNLDPSGHLAFTLPRVHFRFTTRFGAKNVEHVGRLHTVMIEPEIRRVVLTWHTHLECSDQVDQLDETVIRLKRVM